MERYWGYPGHSDRTFRRKCLAIGKLANFDTTVGGVSNGNVSGCSMGEHRWRRTHV